MARKKTKKKTARKKRTTKKKGARKTARKKTRRKTKKKMARRRGRRSKLANVPVAQLQAELERRQRELLDQREELQQQVDRIDQELAVIGTSIETSPRPRRGRPPGRPAGTTRSTRTRGRRPRGKVTLVDALQTALRGKTMGVSEVSQAVQKAGYKTKSKNFRTIVNLALTQHTDKFKRVSRGQYTAK